MGSSASKGSDNDELVDNLLKDQYLKTPSIQQIFRAVDRGLYFTKDYRKLAYDDTAWRNGNIHLSAPGIYCEVLENLELGEGMSFLNLGSGTGYLNTMAGLIIGSYGVNYGVEFHKDVIEFAYDRLEKFKQTAEAIDEYDFCEPKFFEGNCMHLSSDNRLYDRVYCGAGCPQFFENYMKNLIKVNGILVMPLEELLVKVKRTSETSWEKKSITPVNFASLILPSRCDGNKPQLLLPNPDPLSLQAICRTSIRRILREIIREENPQLKHHRIRKEHRSRRNGSDDPSVKQDLNYQHIMAFNRQMLRNIHDSSFFSLVSAANDDGDDDDDDDDGDDNSSVERELDDTDEDMDKIIKETDEEEDGDSEKTTEKKSEEGPRDPPPSDRVLTGMKRKKVHSHSYGRTGLDESTMDMDLTLSDSERLENGDKSASETVPLNSASEAAEAGESSTEKCRDSASCSTNGNVGSTAESDEEDEAIIVRERCRKFRDLIRQRRLKKAKKDEASSRSSVDQSEDEYGDGKTEVSPTVCASYSVLMREKINSLPLPRTIQSYLNFHRTL